jgi:hypothetical protein
MQLLSDHVSQCAFKSIHYIFVCVAVYFDLNRSASGSAGAVADPAASATLQVLHDLGAVSELVRFLLGECTLADSPAATALFVAASQDVRADPLGDRVIFVDNVPKLRGKGGATPNASRAGSVASTPMAGPETVASSNFSCVFSALVSLTVVLGFFLIGATIFRPGEQYQRYGCHCCRGCPFSCC